MASTEDEEVIDFKKYMGNVAFYTSIDAVEAKYNYMLRTYPK